STSALSCAVCPTATMESSWMATAPSGITVYDPSIVTTVPLVKRVSADIIRPPVYSRHYTGRLKELSSGREHRGFRPDLSPDRRQLHHPILSPGGASRHGDASNRGVEVGAG